MSKRKTHAEYVDELKRVNPDIIPIEEYVDWQTPILHLCKIHNYKWNAVPNNILRGGHCPECRKDATKKANRLSHDEYVLRLKDVNPTVIPLENYISLNTPISHKCLIHDIKWDSTPASILQGSGCSKCKAERLRDYHGFTHEEYVDKVKEANPTVEVIGTYINANTNIEHRCLIHNYKWIVSPYSILQGHGCKYCQSDKTSEKLAKTQEQYINELSLKNPNIICLGEYKNSDISILHQCLRCGYKWETSPASILQGSDCPKCAHKLMGEQRRKTQEVYEQELYEVNPNLVCLEQYVLSTTPILHKCLIDGYEWRVTPGSLLQGHGCPKCNISKGEDIIEKWLISNQFDYVTQKRFDDCKDERVLPFDFYLPDSNTCIEYDGEQHYRPVDFFGGEEYYQYILKHDEIKNKYCEDNNIPLLRIPYYADVETELSNFLLI